MKRDKKYESSALGAFIGMTGIMVICLVMVIMNYFTACNVGPTDNKLNNNFFYLILYGSTNKRKG